MTDKTKMLAARILLQCQEQGLTYGEARDLAQNLEIIIDCAREEAARRAVLTEDVIETVTKRLEQR